MQSLHLDRPGEALRIADQVIDNGRTGPAKPADRYALLRQKRGQNVEEHEWDHDDQDNDGVHPARTPYLALARSKADKVSLSSCQTLTTATFRHVGDTRRGARVPGVPFGIVVKDWS
jgi:hypothetical protein